jgi:hypothetical protein
MQNQAPLSAHYGLPLLMLSKDTFMPMYVQLCIRVSHSGTGLLMQRANFAT